MSLNVRTDTYVLANTADEAAEASGKIRAFVLSAAITLGIGIACVLAVLLHVS